MHHRPAESCALLFRLTMRMMSALLFKQSGSIIQIEIQHVPVHFKPNQTEACKTNQGFKYPADPCARPDGGRQRPRNGIARTCRAHLTHSPASSGATHI